MSTPSPSHRPAGLKPRTALTTPALERMHDLMQISGRQLLTAVLTGVLTLASAFALAAVSGYLITKSWTMPPVLDLSVAVVSVRALGISRGVFRYLERLFTHDTALSGVARLRTNLYAGLATASDTSVSRLRRGDLLGRIGDDAEDMANDVIRAVIPGFVALVMAVIVVATIAPFSPLAAVCMVLGLALASVVAPLLAYRAALITERDVVDARSELSAVTMHAIDHSDELRVAGKFGAAQENLARAQASYDSALDKAAMPAALARACLHVAMIPALLGSILAAGAVFLTPHSGVLGGFMGHSPGVIGVLLLLPLSSFEAATILPAAAQQRARTLVAAQRLAHVDFYRGDSRGAIIEKGPSAVRQALQDATDAAGASLTPGSMAIAQPNYPTTAEDTTTVQPPSASLHARNLVVGWRPDAPLLRIDALDVKPGSRILIYGSSGRGKSTLALTLAGLLTPLSGSVTVDGHDLSEMAEADRHARITFFAEDAHIFATSVRENIRVVNGALTDTDIKNALKRAGLAPWLTALPRGLDTALGAHGTDVSGGERRRLLLARAIAAQAPITILDEATEHLDMELARELMHGILTPGEFFGTQHSVVVITHDARFKDSGYPVLDLDTMTVHGSEEETA